jgi:IS1 family transposase
LGFTLGDRSAETGAKLYKALADFEISSYYTDYWTAYESGLYKEHHVRSKAATYGREYERLGASLFDAFVRGEANAIQSP